jgi:hypothetical protein
MSAYLSSKRYWAILLLIATLSICYGRFRTSTSSAAAINLDRLPRVILWAWERPENLSFLNSREVGVAYLAKTLRLKGGVVIVRPRLQPLTVPNGTQMIAVARVETDRSSKPELSERQITTLVQEVSEMSTMHNVVAVQVDFDAVTSERTFYQQVISRLRQQLKPSIPLSITALGSWCEADDWLTSLPVDEAVPMLFRMGVDRQAILSRVNSGTGFTAKPCQSSVGVSTDEIIPLTFSTKRVYIFSPEPWSERSFQTAMEIYHR